MTCIRASKKAEIEATLIAKKRQLALANAAYEEALGRSSIESYRFDSGEGSQSTKYRSPKEIAAEVRALEADISVLERQLRGDGLVSVNLRRYG